MSVHFLRIRVAAAKSGGRRVSISLTSPGQPETQVEGPFRFSMADDDRRRLRAYWEDYLEYPGRIATADAAQAERTIAEVGGRLFRAVFSTAPAIRLWGVTRLILPQTRVEIEIERGSDTADIPWEYLCDPDSKTFVSSSAGGFVRRPADRGLHTKFEPGVGPIRVLLVASRPPVDAGLAFRPTTRRLFHAAHDQEHATVTFDLLRPPTLGQLSNVLLEMEAAGRPYHVVQIDGHAYLLDPKLTGAPEELHARGRAPRFVRQEEGRSGYLPFEDPTGANSVHLLGGGSLGDLLHEAHVPVLILNARRASDSTGGPFAASPVEAFDSVAHAAVGRGVAAVLSLPSCVDTAGCAQFLYNVYENLARGVPLGEVATAGRQWLRSNPGPKKRTSRFIQWDLAARKWRRDPEKRDVVEGLVREEDWLVPIVYEAEAKSLTGESPTLAGEPATQRKRAGQERELVLPQAATPDLYGQEDTLVAIERAWETNSVVLLHGPAGCGKTAVAVEYATWYTETIQGARVVYSNFEDYRSLASVAAELKDLLDPVPREDEPHWARDPYSGLPKLMNQGPLLWIWDGVEHLSGAATGSDTGSGAMWNEEERDLFLEVLELAQQTTADILLLSRDREQYWLGETAMRIEVPPLPLRQSLQLIHGVLNRRNRRMVRGKDWLPLAHFARGNPAVLRCLTEQAASEGVESEQQVVGLVTRARGAYLRVPDKTTDIPEPLCAAAGYVLKKSFSSGDRSLLSLLSLFQGTVSRELLAAMAGRNGILGLPELRTLSEYPRLEDGADDNVLERAARLGLLNRGPHGVFEIPSVTKPFVRALFRGHYSDTSDSQQALWDSPPSLVDPQALPNSAVDGVRGSVRQRRMVRKMVEGETAKDAAANERNGKRDGVSRANRAYLEVIGRFGLMCARDIECGHPERFRDLARQEGNLMRACRLAVAEERWTMAAGAVEGLCEIYRRKGWLNQWDVFLVPLLPLCGDRATKQSHVDDRADLWRAVIGQSALLAQRKHRWKQARNYQELCVEWDRKVAVDNGTRASAGDEEERDPHRELADSLYRLSDILRDQGEYSIQLDEEAVTLLEELGEKTGAAGWSMELGRSYAGLPEGRGLNQAERWLKRALHLIGDDDQRSKAHCLAELGRIAWLQFVETRRAAGTEHDLRRHLNRARRYYQRAIEFDPEDDFASLAAHHKDLGHVSMAMGDVHFALPHYRESIRYDDLADRPVHAATTRFELAIDLRNAGHSEEALEYARAAFDQLSALSEESDAVLMRARLLLEELEQGSERIWPVRRVLEAR